jgi:hypothetical protein
MGPERIHITHVEDHSSPAIYYMVLFKVEDETVGGVLRDEKAHWVRRRGVAFQAHLDKLYGGFMLVTFRGRNSSIITGIGHSLAALAG